ncbi:hypothetical protein [Geomesophilobacter sediminis]|uniref:Uncharacterized protein n=1 Tax=Geomesophilobacter sediminis TaxID=2798584 RepID=A0A8J7M328_9BACT|nr:hypothetical protein [Geomesophilobacter sediminis]MBJ6727629.1 hypothetical protein [Geomesophilobacter sediminis]
MRYLLLLAMVLVAGECRADDPLESLNTVQDTVRTMRHALQTLHPPPEAAPRTMESRRDNYPQLCTGHETASDPTTSRMETSKPETGAENN